MGRQKLLKEGTVIKVPLKEKLHCYARILTDNSCAFYDCFTEEEISVEIVILLKILFIIPIYNSALKSKRWEKIAFLPLEEQLQKNPPMFMQDVLNPDQFSIYDNGKIRPATREECEGLERCAVWDEQHVEERLLAYYEGRPSIVEEHLKMK